MNRSDRRAIKHAAEREDRKHGGRLVRVAPDEWPQDWQPDFIKEVWRSKDYLVQVFDDPSDPEVERLTVIDVRNSVWRRGRVEKILSWEELQDIKGQVGRGESWAVEVYPPTGGEVNVAPMRHLWCLPADRVGFAWR